MSIIERATRKLQETQQSSTAAVIEMPVQRQPARNPGLNKRFVAGWMLASMATGFVLGMVVSGALYKPASPQFPSAQQAPSAATRTIRVAPVTPVQPTPAAADQNNNNDKQKAVLKHVDNWVKAWSDKDLDNYLAAYAPEFQPPGGLTRPEWEKQRRQRLGKYSKIEIRLSDMQIMTEGDTATVEFIQSFKADGFSETGLRKRLELRQQGNRWLTVKETTIKG